SRAPSPADLPRTTHASRAGRCSTGAPRGLGSGPSVEHSESLGGHAVNELPQQLVNGLLLGSMYGLVAIGYTMVYGIIQLINFAHGEIFMVGGFGALTVYLYVLPDGTSMWVALPLMLLAGILVSVLVAVGAERFAYRPLRGAPRLAPLITAIGLSLALQQAIWACYPNAKSKLAFPQIEGGPFTVAGATIQTGDIFLLIAAPV